MSYQRKFKLKISLVYHNLFNLFIKSKKNQSKRIIQLSSIFSILREFISKSVKKKKKKIILIPTMDEMLLLYTILVFILTFTNLLEAKDHLLVHRLSRNLPWNPQSTASNRLNPGRIEKKSIPLCLINLLLLSSIGLLVFNLVPHVFTSVHLVIQIC